MAFNPTSTIYLCNVPIDNTYKNQIYFDSAKEQYEYFVQHHITHSFSDYLTVRTTRPDGTLQSSVKVNRNIDALRNSNYMVYQNENHSTKWFYAFITKFVYINENTTEVVFETDVWQTWMFNVDIMDSYVVREHSETDEIGDNLVPEKFNFQDYVYQVAYNDAILDGWGYLIGTTENDIEDASFWEEVFDSKPVIETKKMSGIKQGLFFYYFDENDAKMDIFLNKIMEKSDDPIVFISLVPEFSVSGANIKEGSEGYGWIYSNSSPARDNVNILDVTVNGSFEGYAPVNNKMFTSPFYKLIVTNHNGEQADYNIEDFADTSDIAFYLYGDISANPTVTLVPRNYKGISKNYDAGISITNFPQVSINTDSFKLWLAKNQYGVAMDTASSIGQILTGAMAVASAPATGGIGGFLGASGVVSGVQGVMSTINGVYQASREPNKSTTGGGRTNLLTAMELNKFEYFIQTIKRDHAITVDNFFTMYGYQTNKVKKPNINSRPHFNYVETVDVNITGSIPMDDMRKLKQMFNNGVTFWKSDSTVGDYSVDNTP